MPVFTGQHALCMHSGGTRCLKPPNGARLQEVVNLSSARLCSLLNSDTTCGGALGVMSGQVAS